MLTVADVMTRDVEAVTPDTSLRALVELLTERHVGGVPVVAGDEVVGVVSATDVLDFVALHEGERPSEGEAEGEEDDPIAERIREEEDEPAAVYFGAVWAGASEPVDAQVATGGAAPPRDPLAEHTVAEAMTSPARVVPATAGLQEAAEVMSRAGIHRVLVMEGSRLVGILTTSDLARAVAGHRLVAPTDFIEVDLRGWP